MRVKRRQREDFRDITKTLFHLLAVGGGVTALASFSPQATGKLAGALTEYGRWRIRATLKRMRLRGYVAYDEEDERSPIVLTEKGLRRAREHELSLLKPTRPKKWDHLWHILLFDVPDTRRNSRIRFQKRLRREGWYRLQDSVYCHPDPPAFRLESLEKYRGIDRDCLLLVAPSLGPFEKKIRRFFWSTARA